ncbi:hypothetical protein OR571_18120 [Psychrobacillus sp. NEAU-3TGS]|uniref:hypothetical protein n=1 Tax=Psychrobacillus sp. NEAU-3TGS TaxID=2995412 RepID=UPI0024974DBB|nr:hypothetical protein [Psychrobacillus sp. NEAU-3TGS]MDI2588957.1 hypothetical protein [Psychrobacillus sp. NEAU-3TGS]
MIKLLFLLIPTLFLIACGDEKPVDTETTTKPPSEEVVTPSESPISLSHFFMPDNSVAQFKGEGNEYATYSLTTLYPFENYVITYEDNGGTVVQRIFNVQENKISLIAENGEAYEPTTHSLAELQAMQEIEVYLATPIEVGATFNDWKITSTTETLETDLQTFDHVIVIEKTNEDNSITRKYFAKNFGEIKREFFMQEGDEQYIVSSVIESME